MKTTLSAQQTSFFTKNGFIELEMGHEKFLQDGGRDQWRHEPKLKDFLLRKLGPMALVLAGKKQLLLACDQMVTKENRPTQACMLKEMFCIQGLAIGVAIGDHPVVPAKKSPLGILPMPTEGHILFFRPDIILDWPHTASDVYIAIFALPSAVYVHNPKDPSTHFLKQFGYNFGDTLKNETHPSVF